MDVVIVAGGAQWEAAAIAEIDESANLRLARRCVDVADLLATVATSDVRIALVDAGVPGIDVDVVRRLVRTGVRVVAVESDGRAVGIATSVRLGSLSALEAPEKTAPVVESGRGDVIAVWGPAGAPGRSTLAAAFATASAAKGRRTALVDADTYGGAQAQLFGVLEDVSGLMAACRDANQGRADAAADHLVALAENLHLLTGLPRPDMWPHVRPAALEVVLDELSARHEVVVVDCGFGVEAGTGVGPSRDQATRQVLEQADEVIVVGRVDPVGLARLARAVDEAGPWQRPPHLVMNFDRPTLSWDRREIASMVRDLCGVEPLTFLPAEQAAIDASLVAGRPLREVAPTAPFVARVDRLVATVLSAQAASRLPA